EHDAEDAPAREFRAADRRAAGGWPSGRDHAQRREQEWLRQARPVGGRVVEHRDEERADGDQLLAIGCDAFAGVELEIDSTTGAALHEQGAIGKAEVDRALGGLRAWHATQRLRRS